MEISRKESVARMQTFALLLFCLIATKPLQINADAIQHNLPDNLEIIDPKSLGLSGSDLEKFLGNVKLLPIEGSLGGSGSPKTQILTVGFDGNEQLNLQDFESISTAGLPDQDKQVAELAFKKFQTFFQNPQTAQDFDAATNQAGNPGSGSRYGGNSVSTFVTSTPPSASYDGSFAKVKHRKRLRNGKGPLFSSTFRSVQPVPEKFETTTQQYVDVSQNLISNFENNVQHSPPSREKSPQPPNFERQHQFNRQPQFENPQTQNFQNQNFKNPQHFQNPQSFQSFQNLQNTQNFQNPQYSPNFPSTLNSPIFQHTQNSQNFQNSQNLQNLIPTESNPYQAIHPQQVTVRTNCNENYYKPPASYTQHQSVVSVTPLHQGHLASSPTGSSDGRNAGQHPHHEVFVQNENSLRANQDHQQMHFPYVAKQPQFSLHPPALPRPFPSVKPQNPFQQNNQAQEQALTFQQYQHVPSVDNMQQQHNVIGNDHGLGHVHYPGASEQHSNQNFNYNSIPPNSNSESGGNHRKQKQMAVTPPPVPKLAQSTEHIILQQRPNPANQQHQQPQAFQNSGNFQHQNTIYHGQNFNEIRYQNSFKNTEIRPSQIDPISTPAFSAQAQFGQDTRIPKKPKNPEQLRVASSTYNGFDQSLHAHQSQRFPQSYAHASSTPKSISMSGVIQITPSTPLIPLSTVENAMTAHNNLVKIHSATGVLGKEQEIAKNQIPGSSTSDVSRSKLEKQGFQAPHVQIQNSHSTHVPAGPQIPPPRPSSKVPFVPRVRRPYPHHPPPLHQLHFRQDPLPYQTSPSQFLPEPSRFVNAPPPAQENSNFGQQQIAYNRFSGNAANGFNFRESKAVGPMPLLQDAGSIQLSPAHNPRRHPPPPPHHAPRPQLHPSRPSQFRPELYQQFGSQHPPPHMNVMSQRNPMLHPDQLRMEDPNFHKEASDYANSLGVNIQSINSAPLIGSFVA